VVIEVAVDKATRYVTMPQTAVVYNPYGNSVFLAVREDGRDALVARQSFVKTGQTRGDQVAVISGIEPGATVVTTGQIKLRNGTTLKVDNAIPVANDANPKLVEQ
jgi:membrane fusion protein (multidrug efflux system)